MMRLITFILLCTSLIFFSCTKENDDIENSESLKITDYFPLNVGNYWVYKYSNCDSLEQNCTDIGIDTLFILRDTIINNMKYFELWDRQRKYYYVKDSADCIVNNSGTIMLSLQVDNRFRSFISNSSDTFAYVDYYLLDGLKEIKVPLGEFSCIDFNGEIFLPDYNNNFSPSNQVNHLLYSKGVGKIKESYHYLYSKRIEKLELVSYKIK